MVAAALTLAAIGCPAWAQPAGPMPPIPVEAQKVGLATMVETVHAIGTIRANQSIVVRPEVAGIVNKIPFSESSRVAKGDVLFALDDSIVRAQLQQAQSSLRLSERNNARAQELYGRGAGTGQARDQAQAALENDRASVALNQARLDQSTIRAPFAGVVGVAKVDLGAYVTVGQDLVTLDDIDVVKLDFEVPERYGRFIAVGQKVKVEADALPGRSFDGEVAVINTRIDPVSRSLSIRATVPNPDGILKPGLFARVTVIVGERQRAIVIPEQAIVPLGNQLLVFRVVEGKAMPVPVKIGLREFGRAEIVEGLQDGDMVVTAGQQKLQPGGPVIVLAPQGGQAQGGP